jgi:hypothetical protein
MPPQNTLKVRQVIFRPSREAFSSSRQHPTVLSFLHNPFIIILQKLDGNTASRHGAITVIIYMKQTMIEMDYELETLACLFL